MLLLLIDPPDAPALQPIPKAKDTPKFALCQGMVPEVPEVIAHMDLFQGELDMVMAENNVTETQLEKSNEPKFTEGLEQKREAQDKAAEAPDEYRAAEQEKLEGAKMLANERSQGSFKDMNATRKAGLTGVNAKQAATEKTDEQMMAEINQKFEDIYNRTKTRVEETLTKLGDEVDEYFEKEAEEAKTRFETNVETKLDDIYGWTVIDDWIWGADTVAIEKVFEEDEEATNRQPPRMPTSAMDKVLDKIAQGIADALNYTLKIVEEGRKESEDYYNSLDKKQQSLAKDSYDNYNSQYDSLEDTVYEKEDELAQGLADAYKENVDSLRETFDEIHDSVAAGWIGAALNAIWGKNSEEYAGICETILKLFEMLFQLLSAVVEAINAILADPIGFLSNLFDGVKKGLDNFITNIKTHLITGLVEWLTGSLGGVGIGFRGIRRNPKGRYSNLFSLPGIFSLCGQILGLSWDYFRAKAVKKLGEPVVKGIEETVDIFIIIKNEGIEGLWKYLQGKFQDLQATVMDAIRDMIITKVVEAGIKWIISLMNPASAFVKAVMMIIDIARFFIERAADIIELVMAFIDGIRALAAGNIEGVAKGIEKALAKSIPILLGFLASLLGISGLTGKVMKIIKKIRKRVDKFINKLISKAKRLFKKKGNKSKNGKKVEEEVTGLTPADHKKHKKYVEEIEAELKKEPKKATPTFEDFYAYRKKQMADLEKKYNSKLTKKVNGKPLKTTITMGALAAEKKDNDLDIKIKIAPNDAEGGVTVVNEAMARPKELEGKSTPTLDKLEIKEPGVSQRYVDNWTGNNGAEKYEGLQLLIPYVEGRAARKLGKKGEGDSIGKYIAAGGESGATKNNETLRVYDKKDIAASFNNRIPDVWKDQLVVADVKDVAEMSLDAQMRDNAKIASGRWVYYPKENRWIQPAKKFDLIVRASKDKNVKGTKVFKPLVTAVENTGGKIYEVI